jgi:hypothetical protein
MATIKMPRKVVKAAAKAAKMSNIKVCAVIPPQSVTFQPVQGKTDLSVDLFDGDIYAMLCLFCFIIANLNWTLQFHLNVSIKIEKNQLLSTDFSIYPYKAEY